MQQLHRSVTISDEPHEHPALDFNALREEGITHLQHLAGRVWTDHNTHDPGITILDQLCYALTDLSYRISFDIKDLLARPGDGTYKSLFSPVAILSSSPVTLNDYRKVLLDINGVKNAWIEKVERSTPEIYFDECAKTLSLRERETFLEDKNLPARELISIRGLYRVFVTRIDPDADPDLEETIWQRLQSCRNLCEDFEEIAVLREELITITGSVEVANTGDINMLAANVLHRLANWLSPSIRFYTLQEMHDKGKRIDEIMDGPALQHGFVDDAELDKFKRLNKLYASDLIREIMAEPGVRVVTDVKISSDVSSPDNWVLPLDNNRVPLLNAEDSLLKGLIFKKNGQPLSINPKLVLNYFNNLQQAKVAAPMAASELDIIPEKREPRDISTYFSIQHHFPQVYGIGEMGLPETANETRKAQARQLKAYLLFFEQLLANYFKQADSIKNLFSFEDTVARTYFSQSLMGVVPGAEELLNAKYADGLAELTESIDLALDRKNRFLDHLLSRFSEDLIDYSLWLNDQQTIKSGQNLNDAVDPFEQEMQRTRVYKETLIKAKLNFLSNYPTLGSQRGKSFDHTIPSWANNNVSGIEKRIAAKLGITDYMRKRLADQEDGFHMLEHILLRPLKADADAIESYTAVREFKGFTKTTEGLLICESDNHGLQNGDIILINVKGKETPYTVSMVFEHNFRITDNFDELPKTWVRQNFNSIIFVFDGTTMMKDPYSFQLTFIFPKDNKRFFDPNFREFIETTIREETPAHLTVYIQWLDKDQLKRFEDAYEQFLERLASQ